LKIYTHILVVTTLVLLATIRPVSGQVPTTATRKPCDGLRCDSVLIDHVSRPGGPKTPLIYITATGKMGVSILSCIYECKVPLEGKVYAYSEQKPEERSFGEQYIFLTGPNENHEQYQLEVVVPELTLSTVKGLMRKCQASDRFVSEPECAKWIRRKLSLEKTPCPDVESTKACKSFEELLQADDPDLMSDLAQQDHIYACFLPDEDVFFEVNFSEPSWFNFAKPSDEQIKDGISPNALTVLGGSEIAYYTNGIWDENKSLHIIGNWIYYRLGEKTDDFKSMRMNATSKRAQFKGQEIEIDNDRWALSETYKNRANTQTRHSLTLQPSTGRFKETYEVTGNGGDLRESNGRCLIVPTDTF
jgi:hypothetical protein